MSTFLTGDELNDAIDDVIINTKKFLFITSPYIKLDDHFKERLEILKKNREIYIHILFGKNESNIRNSFNRNDLDFFKEFKNISIIYEPKLHAKAYRNESEGVITSMNLYDYSAENNVEFGVYFKQGSLTDNLYRDLKETHYEILEGAHCIYIRRPIYKKAVFGLIKKAISSEILLDKTKLTSINSRSYEQVIYHTINVERIFENDLVESLKSRSEKKQEEDLKKRDANTGKPKMWGTKHNTENQQKVGYCIRTGVEIDYNPKRPMSYDAYKVWVEYANFDFNESYCHQTGERSGKKTSMRKPILNSNYENKEIIIGKII
ncbi:phospholipase D family protein [Nonlabens sp. Asnod3-H03]|uniref:phospholipase D family protein n=1 Tax=Nonlabens sp. Asnod3-H03 TaxID=3160580 RepID=UPI00386BCA55